MVSMRQDQKNKKDPHQTETVIRVTSQSILSRSLEMNIETDMDPVSITRVTPPSHSSISQQMLVTYIHGGLAYNLSIPHSEVLDIETGRHQLRSPNFIFLSLCQLILTCVPG